MRKCLYCNKPKKEDEFSQEHVLPRGVGGALTPVNPFSVDDVCKRCNSICGLFIDAPFIKSWFIKNQRASNAKRFVKLDKSTVLPLSYMGIIDQLEFKNKICEFWLGPTGDTIYHFHETYPQEEHMSPIVGPPPSLKKSDIDDGFVFLYIRSNNPDWHPTIINSLIANFSNSTLYLGNGPTPPGNAFSDIPNELNELHEELNSMSGETHENQIKIGASTGERFLAKIALGFGSIVLDDSFKDSQSADLLREFMWTKEVDKRHNIPVKGRGFLGHQSNFGKIDEILKWPGGHSFAMMPTGDSLALYSNFYEESSAAIQITNEKKHWDDENIDEGLAYVVVPGLQKAVGPLSIAELLAHKTTPDYEHESLKKLEQEMSTFDELPPYDI